MSGKSYSVIFTPHDADSTNLNEMAYQIRTAPGGGGTVLAAGSCTSGVMVTTATFVDAGLAGAISARYIRQRDGANNWSDTLFYVSYTAPTPPPSRFGPRVRAELCSADGTPLNAGNLETILACSYGGGLAKIGTFSLQVPAEDVNSGTANYGQEVRIYREGEGLVFRGIVDHLETQVQDNGELRLTIAGQGVEVQLARAGTQTGLTLNAVTLSSAVTSLLSVPALNLSGWISGTLDTPATVFTQIVLTPVWGGLQALADTFQLYLRPDNLNKRVDIGAFGTNVSGLEFRNLEEIGVGLDSNPRLYPLKQIRIVGDSASVTTRIIPLAQMTGINNVNFDISQATVTSPYARASMTGPDGQTVYYIEDTAASALYGVREVVRRYKGISPLGLTASDFQNAANQLIQNAGTDLQRESQVVKTYEVIVTDMPHLVSGIPIFKVGDTIHVVYRGIAQDLTAKRVWLNIDAQLYVMDFTRQFAADGSDTWTLAVSTVRRQLATDGNVTAALLEQIQAVQSAPDPYIMLNSSDRFDKYGHQIVAGTSLAGKYFFEFLVAALQDNPSAAFPLLARGAYVDTVTAHAVQEDISAYYDSSGYGRRFVYADNSPARRAGVEAARGATKTQAFCNIGNADDGEFYVTPGLRLPALAARPAGAPAGTIWYKTDNKLYLYNGTTDVDLTV